jgi:hypothetical protein
VKLNFIKLKSDNQPKLKARGKDSEYHIFKYDGKLELYQFTHEMSYLLHRGGTINSLKKIAKGVEETC